MVKFSTVKSLSPESSSSCENKFYIVSSIFSGIDLNQVKQRSLEKTKRPSSQGSPKTRLTLNLQLKPSLKIDLFAFLNVLRLFKQCTQNRCTHEPAATYSRELEKSYKNSIFRFKITLLTRL